MPDMQIYWTFVAPALVGLYGAFIYGLAVYLDRPRSGRAGGKHYLDLAK